jgi:hypothetical protein
MVGELNFIKKISEHRVGTQEILAIATEQDNVFSYRVFLGPVGKLSLIKHLKLHFGSNKGVIIIALLKVLVKSLLIIQNTLKILYLHLIAIRYSI